MPRLGLLEGVRRLFSILVEGFATLNRRLWVLVVPVGLDLFLWLGPRVSLRRLVEPLATMLQQSPQADAESIVALQEWGAHANLIGLLADPLTGVLVPRLAEAAPAVRTAPAWEPAPFLLFVAGLAALALLLFAWSLYLVPLADLVRGSREGGLAMLRRVPGTWWRMAAFVGLVLGAGGGLLLGLSVVAMLGELLIPGVTILLALVAGTTLLWGVLLLYLAPAAVLVSAVNPWRAIVYSLRLARYRLWPLLGFLLLTTVVRTGIATLGGRLAGQPLLLLLAILVNGYVAAGLAAAGLVFYREMLRDWLGGQTRGNVVQ